MTGQRFCTECGTPVEGLRFCTECGSPVASAPDPDVTQERLPPVPAEPVQPAPAQPQYWTPQPASQFPNAGPPLPPSVPARRRPRTGAIVGVVMLLLVLAGAGAGGYYLWAQGDDPAEAAETTAADDRETPGDTTESPSETAEPSDAATSASPEPETYVCWDGANADSLSDCSRPRGAEGLEWVFPSFDRNDPSCYDAVAGTTIKRPAMWECNVQVDGRPVKIRYSQVVSLPLGIQHYEEQYAGGRRFDVTDVSGQIIRYVWRLPVRNNAGVYKLSSMYTSTPFSMSVEAGSVADREMAFRRLVEFRAPSEFRGQPA